MAQKQARGAKPVEKHDARARARARARASCFSIGFLPSSLLKKSRCRQWKVEGQVQAVEGRGSGRSRVRCRQWKVEGQVQAAEGQGLGAGSGSRPSAQGGTGPAGPSSRISA